MVRLLTGKLDCFEDEQGHPNINALTATERLIVTALSTVFEDIVRLLFWTGAGTPSGVDR